MTFDITPIVTAVIGLCTAVITYVVVPWVKNKASEQKQEELLKWVKIAVAAAEQLYDSTQGKAKKMYVLEYLNDKGYNISTEDVDIAIEAAVNELHNALKKAG